MADVQSKVVEIIVDKLGVKESEVVPGASFTNDLGTDSLDTEEQVRAETARCLGCGASIVDPNKCIGCGLCTTMCAFDAIHLDRDRPECSTMVKYEQKLPSLGKYALKRAIKIKFGKK